ncbi:hypothetical protein CEW81_18330 [Kluyvera genomosp. 3]|uniref:Uncharacterized protein n=1 Tax=Kluyvera genomosp. 3 TaxID=2774055 RepID=A0A248KKX5_9ENTR|nr:hypothetical protein CEW81_18330 [Kluyvera genomosp. 3]
MSGLLEPIITDFVNGNGGIDYENSVVAGLTPAEQAALDAYGSGAAIAAGKSIAGLVVRWCPAGFQRLSSY